MIRVTITAGSVRGIRINDALIYTLDVKMKLTNIADMQSLSEATKPLLVVSRLIGMNPKSNWHKVYTVFVILCVLSTIFHVWHYYSRMDFKNRYLNVFVYILEETCRTTSLLVILGSSLFDRKRFMVPIKDFASVDQSLKSLNAFIDDSGTHRFQILLVIYIGLTLLIFGPVKFSLSTLPNIDDELYRIVVMGLSYTLVIIIVCAIADSSYLSTLSIIRKRFKKINWIIDRHARKHGSYLRINFLIEVSRKYTVNYVTRDLRILRTQYHDLWGIANQINEAYGLHLLVGAMTSLVLITSKLWTCYAVLTDPDGINFRSLIEGIIWVMFYITRMFLLVKAAESTVAAAKATYVVLQELGMKSDYDCATNGEIKDFLTQLQFEVRKFTACGFFDIDFTLIFGILGAASTYLVILIQMDYREN